MQISRNTIGTEPFLTLDSRAGQKLKRVFEVIEHKFSKSISGLGIRSESLRQGFPYTILNFAIKGLCKTKGLKFEEYFDPWMGRSSVASPAAPHFCFFSLWRRQTHCIFFPTLRLILDSQPFVFYFFVYFGEIFGFF